MTRTDGDAQVLIVDDSAKVRKDLRTLLELIDGIQVAGGAAGAESARQQARRLQPDIILLDLALGEPAQSSAYAPAGLEGCAAIPFLKAACPTTLIFVLTVHGYPRAEQGALRAGADAFFVKGRDLDALLDRIRSYATRNQRQLSAARRNQTREENEN